MSIVVFDEILLPIEYSAVASGGPEFLTTVITARSGVTQRNVNRLEAKGRWQINFDLLTPEQIEELHSFFRARYGRARGFRFRAPEHWRVAGEVFATGDGATTQFPLYIYYRSGPSADRRRITKPVAGGLQYDDRPNTVRIYVNGTEATNVSVSSTTGIVTFQTAPANGATLSWTGEFDTPVTFGSDTFGASFDVVTAEWRSVELVELLPAELGL
jgi:uncharacterized protein (TIGR02217 family)